MYIFISHSSNDAASAEKVCELLEDAGNQCFIAPRNIRSGKEYAEELILGIERSDALVLMLSQSANNSPHVLREVEHAASRSIPILVYKMEEVTLTKSMEYFLMTHQWMNQKAGADFGIIVQCISDLQKELDEKGGMKEDAQPVFPKRSGSKHKFAKAAALTAVILMMAALAVIIGFSVKSEQSAGQQEALKAQDIQLGDFVTLGKYNSEPIVWRVVHLSDDGSSAVLITDDIITMKAYDSAESERFNVDNGSDYWKYGSGDFENEALEARVRGNNEWGSSNIRTWLNSDSQNVEYKDGAPSNMVMSDMKNGYDQEEGFLYGFTDEEKAALIETRVESKGNALSEDSIQITSDRIFLLDLDELDWLEEADVSILAKPTEAAVSQDATGWYGVYSLDLGIESYYWWLREPKEGNVSQCYMVTNGYTPDTTVFQTVGVEGFGIRPAAAVDLQALAALMSQ